MKVHRLECRSGRRSVGEGERRINRRGGRERTRFRREREETKNDRMRGRVGRSRIRKKIVGDCVRYI